MNYAAISLLAILFAIIIGFWRHINVGFLSLGLAFLLGSGAAGFTAKQIIAFWPTNLFVTLIGVSMLFSMARVNGTLEQLARRCVSLARGNGPLIPWIFFFLAAIFAAIGPGNIAVVAILGPIAMTIAQEMTIPPILMAAFLIGGANAGGMSPIAPTGIIGVNLTETYLGASAGNQIWLATMLASFAWCFLLYIFYGGYRLTNTRTAAAQPPEALERRHWLTIAGMAVLIVAVSILKWDLGLTAFAVSAVLLTLKAANEQQSMAGIPWGAMILVAGTGTLIEVTAALGGIDLLTSFFRRFMTAATATSLMGLISAVMTFFASASGVVMPTLIRTLPGLLAGLPGISAAAMAAAITAGGHLITTGPFTTLGALASASLTPQQDRQDFLKQQMLTALGSVVFSFLFFFLLFRLPWLQ
ncbi:MAG: hypothetical protein LLG09_00140 [Negativicutes bacterium]|nr:hypothetical protein [Negativicutes bacterium]